MMRFLLGFFYFIFLVFQRGRRGVDVFLVKLLMHHLWLAVSRCSIWLHSPALFGAGLKFSRNSNETFLKDEIKKTNPGLALLQKNIIKKEIMIMWRWASSVNHPRWTELWKREGLCQFVVRLIVFFGRGNKRSSEWTDAALMANWKEVPKVCRVEGCPIIFPAGRAQMLSSSVRIGLCTNLLQ